MIFELVIIFLWPIAAWIIKSWAELWGKPGLPYFFSSLLLTPVVPVFVLLLKGPGVEIAEATGIEHGSLKRCPRCAEAIRSTASVCRFCGAEQASAPLAESPVQDVP